MAEQGEETTVEVDGSVEIPVTAEEELSSMGKGEED